jgi:hypothetical protein
MFFNWFRHRPHLNYGGGTSFIRIILMVIVFAGMCWAFWANSERYTTKFSAAGRLNDEIGAFSEEQKKEITAIIGRFSRDLQVKLRVNVRNRVFTSPDAVEGELLFGISPEHKQVVIFIPPLWRAAIGSGFIYQLRGEIMEPAFENGAWREASIKALLLMEHRFDSVFRSR